MLSLLESYLSVLGAFEFIFLILSFSSSSARLNTAGKNQSNVVCVIVLSVLRASDKIAFDLQIFQIEWTK